MSSEWDVELRIAVLCIIPERMIKKFFLPSDRRKKLQQKATLNINLLLNLGIDRHVNRIHTHHHHKDIDSAVSLYGSRSASPSFS